MCGLWYENVPEFVITGLSFIILRAWAFDTLRMRVIVHSRSCRCVCVEFEESVIFLDLCSRIAQPILLMAVLDFNPNRRV